MILIVRDTIEPFQALQQSLNAGWVPFAALRGWYLLLAQLARDGIDGDKVHYAKSGPDSWPNRT